jgi:hypothetical protein
MNGCNDGGRVDEIKDYIAQRPAILTMTAFRFWLESVAQGLKTILPNSGYSEEWLALDHGLPEGDQIRNSRLFENQLTGAVEARIRWLVKLDRVMSSETNALDQQTWSERSHILRDGLRIFKVESAMQANETLTNWLDSTQTWLLEHRVGVESLDDWNSIGNNPFRIAIAGLDSLWTWEMYWDVVCKRYRWLADFIFRSKTIENQFRGLQEIDSPG